MYAYARALMYSCNKQKNISLFGKKHFFLSLNRNDWYFWCLCVNISLPFIIP